MVSVIFSLTITAFLIPILIATPNSYHSGAVTPRVSNGRIDASEWDFKAHGLIPLNGDWRFFPDQLLTPADLRVLEEQGTDAETLRIPAVLPASDYRGGTLVTTVLLPPGLSTGAERPGQAVLGLKLRYFSSANAVWIDGVQYAETGRVSLDPSEYQARYEPAEISFVPAGEEVELLIQFSNFHHRRIRLNEIFLGPARIVQSYTQHGILKDAILLGSLILVAVYYGILFLVQHNEPANIHLSFIALLSAARLSVVGDRILLRIIPGIPAELMMKIGFAASVLMLPLLVLYVKEVTPSPRLELPAKLAKYAAIITGALVVLTPLRVYDLVFEYLQVLIILGGIYTLYVVLRGPLPATTPRSGLLASGGALLLLAGVNDVLREASVIHTPELFSAAMVVFLVLQGVLLAWRYHETYLKVENLAEENSLMIAEIRGLNRTLEERIRARTQELENSNARLEQLTRIDPLTGLANRRAVDERYQLEKALSRREGTSLAVLMIDIDAFKPYNDNYGHPAGDICLQQISAVIRGCCSRGTDLAARYGGEEFIVLLANTTTEGARTLAEKIRTGIEELTLPHEYSPTASYVTVSIGVAAGVPAEEPEMRLIHQADKALYMAKAAGRNRTHGEESAPNA
ncbi:MAG: diguanylate cyclase [Spirochaetaceae bacterium]|nr:MAG: diguanylate cyclase [Spirochaetaceae bacterium]